MIALMFTLLLGAAPISDDPPANTSREFLRAKELFVGDWKITALTEDGERLGPQLVERKLARDGLLRVSDRLITFDNPETNEVQRLAYRLDSSKSPRQIDIISRGDRILAGIYKFEGDSLFLCVQSRESGTRPDAFEAPQGSGRILATLKIDTTARPAVTPKPEAEPVLQDPRDEDLPRLARERASRFSPEVRRAHELLAGNWDIVAIEDDGERLGSELIRAKFAEKGRIVIGTRTASLTAPVSGERRISAIQIDPTKSPSHVNVTNQFDQVLKGIYRFDGDHLKLCLSKDEDDDRPTDFTASSGSGRILFDLKMAPSTPKPVEAPVPVTREVVKARPMVESVDDQVRDRLVGSWSIVDRKGTLTFVIRRDGTFTSTRNWKKAVKRMFQGGDTTSWGRWTYARGILSAQITRTTDFSMAGHVLYGNIQSIGENTMVIRSDLGELMTATKLR